MTDITRLKKVSEKCGRYDTKKQTKEPAVLYEISY